MEKYKFNIDEENYNQKTPMELAVDNSHYQITVRLVARDAKIPDKMLNESYRITLLFNILQSYKNKF